MGEFSEICEKIRENVEVVAREAVREFGLPSSCLEKVEELDSPNYGCLDHVFEFYMGDPRSHKLFFNLSRNAVIVVEDVRSGEDIFSSFSSNSPAPGKNSGSLPIYIFLLRLRSFGIELPYLEKDTREDLSAHEIAIAHSEI